MAEHPEQKRKNREADDIQAEAQQTLNALKTPQPNVLGSTLADAATRARDHFGAVEADPHDRIEVWGRRIARLAALGFVVWLIVSLIQDWLIAPR